MTYARRSLRLYLSNREWALLIPIYTLSLVTFVSVLIAVIIGIASGFPLSPEAREGFRNNGGTVYSIPGFLVTAGALACNRNFAMALAFGSTRRHFWLGTTAGFLVTAASTAAASVAFLGIERLTGHWFIGAHAFDVNALGNGDVVTTFSVVFVLCLLALLLGAMFGTVYRAFGTRWTTVVALLSIVVVFAAVAVGVWQRDVVVPWFIDLGVWSAVVIGGAIAAVSALGSYVANRFATI